MYLNLLIILSFVFLSLLSISILFINHDLYLGFDTQFHFRRVMELNTSLLNGNLLPDFSFNEFHGSAAMALYPYLNLLPVVLLSLFIKSKIDLVYGFVAFNTLLSFIISFYSSKNYTHSYKISYIFSIIYSLSNVFLLHNIVSSDIGIASSYIFLPLIIFAFFKIINGKNSWIQLGAGMSLLLYSHIINLILVSLCLFIFLIFNVKNINKHIIINLIKSITLFIFMSSIVWIPFIHLYLTNLNYLNMPETRILYKIDVKSFLSGLYGSKTSKTIGFFPLIALFISPYYYKKLGKYVKQMYMFALVTILCALFLPWQTITKYNSFKLLNQIQMTDRFLIIPIMLLSFILSLIISEYINFVKIKKFIYILTIILAIFLQLTIGQYAIIHKFSKNPSVGHYLSTDSSTMNIKYLFKHPINNSIQFDRILNNYYLSDDDYIPKSALSSSKYINNNTGFYNNNNKIKVKHIGYNTFKFYGDNINKLSLPVYIYNKERLNIYLNGKKVKNYSNNEGLLTIDHIQNYVNSNNTIYIKPISSSFKITGIILSLLSWLIILFILLKNIFINGKL